MCTPTIEALSISIKVQQPPFTVLWPLTYFSFHHFDRAGAAYAECVEQRPHSSPVSDLTVVIRRTSRVLVTFLEGSMAVLNSVKARASQSKRSSISVASSTLKCQSRRWIRRSKLMHYYRCQVITPEVQLLFPMATKHLLCASARSLHSVSAIKTL